jgi:hypothetical protein
LLKNAEKFNKNHFNIFQDFPHFFGFFSDF